MELIDATVNRRIRKLLTRYRKKTGKKSLATDELLSRRIEWVRESLEFDGIHLTSSDLYTILESGKIPQEMKLSELVLALNYNDAYKLVERAAISGENLSEGLLLRLHKTVVRNLSDDTSGEYRKHPVRKKGGFAPPHPEHIQNLVQDLCRWVESYKDRFEIQDLAFWAHHRIVYIRPFVFGTETVARHILNFILFSKDLPPMSVGLEGKNLYDHFNQEANLDIYPGYMTFMGEILERSLNVSLKGKPGEDDTTDLTMARAATIAGVSRDKLSRDARSGKLKAFKKNRVWFTSARDLEEYMQTLEIQ